VFEKCFEFFKKMWNDEFDLDLSSKFSSFKNSQIFYIGKNEII
jgi:hypothetical protein